MKLYPIALAVVLLAPLGAGLAVPRVAPESLYNPTDAELMLTLARLNHPDLVPLTMPIVKPGDTLESITLRLAERGGRADLSTDDLAGIAALDARVSGPMLLLLTGVEAYWDAYDAATATLTPDEIALLVQLRAADLIDTPEFRAADGEITKERLFAAGIMLVDLTESVVVPALQDAVRAGAWPATATADPVGVLRLGGAGNDPAETLNRIVQIDPSGDDRFYNNAGGATHLDALQEGTWNILSPVGISIDFDGNDQYNSSRSANSQGAGNIGGFGVLLDYAGNDVFWIKNWATGAAEGYGLLHDYAGTDRYRTGEGIGHGISLAVLRDDAGDDIYDVLLGGGVGRSTDIKGTGVHWDRAGADRYLSGSTGGSFGVFGWGFDGARGWFVDEGTGEDYYVSAYYGSVVNRHGCNDCTWEMGDAFDASPVPVAGFPKGGQGNDNAGGLAYLLAEQDAFVRLVCDPAECV